MNNVVSKFFCFSIPRNDSDSSGSKAQNSVGTKKSSKSKASHSPPGLTHKNPSSGISSRKSNQVSNHNSKISDLFSSCIKGSKSKAEHAENIFQKARLLSLERKNKARADALSGSFDTAPDTRKIVEKKSIRQIASESGVSIHGLENYFQERLNDFFEKTKNSNGRSYGEYNSLIESLYNIFLHSQDEEAPSWVKKTRSFDSFVEHFCPQASKKSQANLIYQVESFCRQSLPPMLQRTSLWGDDNDNIQPIYNGARNWLKLPEALVARDVIKEARELANNGYWEKDDLFVHGTGSAAIDNFAKNQAIWSASLAISKGDKVATGEFASYILSDDGETSFTGGNSGLGDVYTSEDGLSSKCYTKQRWFDEFPITFGISQIKQKEYNIKNKVERSYRNPVNDGITVGPVVPLENVVAVSAPKANEARVRSWIEAHCPHAQFISYEAATLLDSKTMFGLRPR
ncbi:hypothetical protein M4R22_02330 [Acidovorax sp. GBBC 3334]|uniref:hypothetical protein n=1 Tax=Acidovorax sp. GBBC 3334 TaxID=2940496 RepID=UPI002302252A|nr:hypothetical protein [Acidovorax sp. GBBC 3334]MDA8453591.1 hypothetical protein [Acidovorax sp. GBBC 3334]